jgi:aminopeptidase N
VAVATAVGLLVGPALAAAPGIGADGAGDPYFPRQGNGGYDVGHYDLALAYTPATRRLTGTATISATATQALSRFDLDLRRSLTVSSVTVNGRAAAFLQPASPQQELVVTPAAGLTRSAPFTVVVTYAGVPQPITDPDGSTEGWIATSDGAFVVSEPQGSPSWFPCNDTPGDKATFAYTVTVPEGVTAVANGELVGKGTADGRTTFSWRMSDPISTYLAFVTTGVFQVHQGRTPGGVPYFVAVDPAQAAESRTPLAQLPAIIDFFATVYGPYPFDSAGAVVDDATDVGYALETATRPSFNSAPDELGLVHELAHQWVGDGVTPARWRDIWLNEGFATWSTWFWSEHTGRTSAQQFFDRAYAANADDSDFWNTPPGDPGDPANLFAGSMYQRGAMTLQALRQKIGDDAAFLALLRDWHTGHRYGNAQVEDFIALTEQRFQQLTDLRHFFDVWLYQAGKPTAW